VLGAPKAGEMTFAEFLTALLTGWIPPCGVNVGAAALRAVFDDGNLPQCALGKRRLPKAFGIAAALQDLAAIRRSPPPRKEKKISRGVVKNIIHWRKQPQL